MALEFEWDETKAVANQQKHGVTFEEAREVFDDPLSLTIADPAHSVDEARFATIGESASGRLLFVSYAQRGVRIRLIGARRASASERHDYEEDSL